MSWWIKQVESFYREPENTYTSKRATIVCDTPQDLPAYNAKQSDANDPFILVYGSDADVISNGRKYILNGSNQWIIQPQSGGGGGSSEAVDINYDNSQSGLSATNVQAAIDELEDEIDSIVPGGDVDAEDVGYNNITSGLTATNVQDAIDELHDTDETQDNALVELYGEDANQQLEIDYAINTGSKNLFDINTTAVQNHVTSTLADDTLTVTSNGNWAHYSVPINLPAGDYIFTTTISNFSKDSSAGATSVRIRIATSTSGGTSVVLETVTGNGPMTIPFTWTGGQFYVQFYPNYSATTTFVSTFTANNVMIRDAVIKSTTYVPYAPTNRELYEISQTKASLSDIYGLKPTIPNGTDLNNLTAGCMTCPGATVAASLLNCPTTTDAFIIYTDYLAATSRAIQRIYSFSTTTGIPAQYMRVRWSQGWTPWYQVTMQSVASVQSVNPVSTLNLNRNDLNESLDTNFDLLDSIPEEEEGEEDDI